MTEQLITAVDRRRFLTWVMPCSLVCLSAGNLTALGAYGGDESSTEELHKFDIPAELKMTPRQRMIRRNNGKFHLIKTLQAELGEEELIRLLNIDSAQLGREVGARQAKEAPDTSFATFTNTFRPPNFANLLTHKIVKDTEKVFQLEVTECLIASVYRDAGVGGEIGHAAVCNMDYYWPPAFNKGFKMERTKTLMQGHECCNHRYLDTA